MEMLVTILVALGLILSLIGTVMLIILAFEKSVLWGIGCLLLIPVQIIFITLNWPATKKSFLCQLTGIVLIIGGFFTMAASQKNGQPRAQADAGTTGQRGLP